MRTAETTQSAAHLLKSLGRNRRAARALELGLLLFGLYLTSALSVYVWQLPNGDVTEYNQYALNFWTRAPLFHSLPVEYPPLAILPFTLTQLPPFGDFHAVYGWWMAALVVLGYLAFLRFSTRRRAIIYAVYLLIGTTATLLARFDIVPGLLTLATLWVTERRRFGYAYALIALGILLKLYPAFLLPIVMIAHWHALCDAGHLPAWTWDGGPRAWLRRLREHPAARRVAQGTALCVGITVVGFLAAMAVAGTDALTGFTYAGDRPLQIESTPATLLWLGTLVGIPARAVFSFQSLNYVGPLDVALKPLSALALAAGCVWVYWQLARRRMTIGQAFVACLCAVIVTNKIFSPQYLIWVLPVVAYVDGFDFLWLAICAFTTIDYPILYQMRHPITTVPYSWQFMPVIALRNLLLLFVTLRAIIRPTPAVDIACVPPPDDFHAPETVPDAPGELAPSRDAEPALMS